MSSKIYAIYFFIYSHFLATNVAIFDIGKRYCFQIATIPIKLASDTKELRFTFTKIGIVSLRKALTIRIRLRVAFMKVEERLSLSIQPIQCAFAANMAYAYL